MLYNYNPLDKENRPTILWMSLLFVAIYWTAIEAPITFILGSNIEEYNLWWDGLFSFIFFTDIYLRLAGKLKLPSPNKINLDQLHNPQTEKPYAKSLWLPIDIFTSLPFDLIMSLFGLTLPTRIISIFRLLRIVRVVKLRSFFDIIDFIPKSLKVVLAISGVMLIIHWISCGWMLLNPRADLDPYSFYNISLYWTVTTLTTVGYGDITPQTNLARLYTMGVMLIGVASYGIIIGNFSRMIMLKDRYEEERKEKMNALHKYMRFYNIPGSLQKQVFSFYSHLLNQNISDQDHQVVNELPQALQNELQIYMKIKLIRAVHIFHDCSTPCLKMIAEKLEQTYHSPNEYIIKKGDRGDEMFILGHGQVEVTMGEKVLTTLKDGQFFGEIALLEDTIRTADVKTKAYCDLYTFKKSDFLEVISKYPNLGDKFKEIYSKRKSDNDRQVKRAA